MNISLQTFISLNLYSTCFFIYFFGVLAGSLYVNFKNLELDRAAFLTFGFCLFIFTLFRPMPLSRDDAAYLDIAETICALNKCGLTLQGSRDWLWYLAISILKSFINNQYSLMMLAAIGIGIKMLVIDRLCKQKMLALLLLIPLVYIQYDFTQLRAGFALSWYFLAILFLAKNRFWLGGSFLGSNFMFHAQALPSILLLPLIWINRNKWILPLFVILFTCLIYAGLFPTLSLMQKFNIINTGANPYLEMTANGGYINVKIFPLGYLPMLAFGLWLCWANNPLEDGLNRIVGASILLAIFLAWIFSFSPTIQTRIFEFYIAPLVLLAGNIGSSKIKWIGTAIVATILYLRLELLNDWILG